MQVSARNGLNPSSKNLFVNCPSFASEPQAPPAPLSILRRMSYGAEPTALWAQAVRSLFRINHVARFIDQSPPGGTKPDNRCAYDTDIPPQMPVGTVDATLPGLRQLYALAVKTIIIA
jgi:hypothetical protein